MQNALKKRMTISEKIDILFFCTKSALSDDTNTQRGYGVVTLTLYLFIKFYCGAASVFGLGYFIFFNNKTTIDVIIIRLR